MTAAARRSVDSLAIEPAPLDKQPERKAAAPQLVTAQPSVEKQPTSSPTDKHEDMVALGDLRGFSQHVLCPYCKTRQQTRVEHKVTDNTFKAGLVCCVIGCVFGFFVPFICRCFSDLNHYCEACGHLVARKPDGGVMEAVTVSREVIEENKAQEPARDAMEGQQVE
ncbi:hypothetical protein QBC44DRAFT_389724 [Cladorrhinum sp. PSN332]|nr:hypothetical protein QBC44DRAFT_389724 [Cladorrhinum sp. PSN332]